MDFLADFGILTTKKQPKNNQKTTKKQPKNNQKITKKLLLLLI